MNIAFTSVIIFVILAPGFLFRLAYKSSKLSVNNPERNLLNDLTWAILPAFILHILFIFFLELVSKYYVNFEQLGNLIAGAKTDDKIESSFSQIKEFLYPIFFYNLAIFSFAIITGYQGRKLIRKHKWDRKYRYLRFSNKWHYIFTGECLDFPDVPDHFDEITDKIINVLCSVNGENILYTGEYFNYYIDKDGNLEAIHLKYPIRKYLKKNDTTENSNYEIESRYLVIPNSDIVNINFRYLSLEEVDISTLTEEEIDNVIDGGEIS
ncbi:hypothetical protein [Winogradskyella forsetii]|uniref:hypothetical protein n=1 Tax=Winogradskyella forsetii TaxID=2686077 RepID=UPI0015B8AA3A|nr:hypothetical protein [Winogradskyella forsetii]